MSHPNGKLSRMSPTAIFSCILLRKNMRKKPPDKYYPPLRYYLALVIVCTVLMYCKQVKAVGNREGSKGAIRHPPPLLGFFRNKSKPSQSKRLKNYICPLRFLGLPTALQVVSCINNRLKTTARLTNLRGPPLRCNMYHLKIDFYLQISSIKEKPRNKNTLSRVQRFRYRLL